MPRFGRVVEAAATWGCSSAHPSPSLFEKAGATQQGRPGWASSVDSGTCLEICLDLHFAFSFDSVPNHSARRELIGRCGLHGPQRYVGHAWATPSQKMNSTPLGLAW